MNRTLLIIGSIVVVTILAGAAYLGAQMVTAPEQAAANSSGGGNSGRVMEIVADDGNGAFALSITFEPAPELPNRPAETSGILVKREDNSFFIGTGDIAVDVDVDGDTGEETLITHHSGPEIEVLISHDTLIYKDITEMDIEPSARQNGEMTVQQVVQPATTPEEINENSELEVWGQRRGDRVIAEVLVYRPADF